MEGALYIASGAEYVEQAKESAKSLKATNELPVTIVCDRSITSEYFDTVIERSDFEYHYGDSVLKIPQLPYEKTLLLDTDTRVYGDLTEIFTILDYFDIAASTVADDQFTLSSSVPNTTFPEYNTGVIGFKKTKTDDFINEWKEAYEKNLEDGIRMNQPSFRETLYTSDLRIATLPTEYNCRVNFGGYLTNKVRILHGRLNNYDKLINELNKIEQPRIFYWKDSELIIEKIETSNQRLSTFF